MISSLARKGAKFSRLACGFAVSEKDFVGKLLRFKVHEFTD